MNHFLHSSQIMKANTGSVMASKSEASVCGDKLLCPCDHIDVPVCQGRELACV